MRNFLKSSDLKSNMQFLKSFDYGQTGTKYQLVIEGNNVKITSLQQIYFDCFDNQITLEIEQTQRIINTCDLVYVINYIDNDKNHSWYEI